MSRKIRSDITLKNLAKKLDVSEEVFRNPDNRKTRNDKLLKTMRRENDKK